MNMYAQVNERSIVHTVCQLAGEVKQDNLIEIEAIDDSLLGKKYRQGKFYGLNIESPKTVKQNEVVNITLKWLDMEGNLVNDTAEITIAIGDIEEKVIAENDVAEIEFSSEELGAFDIKAVCEDGCAASERIEVVEDA